MTWSDLYRLASDARCDLLLLDRCLMALSQSQDPALHAQMTAEIPSAETLCMALDRHGVPAPYDVEAQVVMRYRFVECVAPPRPVLTLGTPATA